MLSDFIANKNKSTLITRIHPTTQCTKEQFLGHHLISGITRGVEKEQDICSRNTDSGSAQFFLNSLSLPHCILANGEEREIFSCPRELKTLATSLLSMVRLEDNYSLTESLYLRDEITLSDHQRIEIP